jgi:hypothetical protein
MTKSAFPARWLDSYGLPPRDPVFDESSNQLLESLDDIFPDLLPDLDIPAVPDAWLDELWRELSSRHFRGTLPAVTIAWAENLKAPARLESPRLILLDTRLMTGDTDRAMGIICMVLLHVAVLVHTRGYGIAFMAVANQIGAALGLKPVKSLEEARQWLFRP